MREQQGGTVFLLDLDDMVELIVEMLPSVRKVEASAPVDVSTGAAASSFIDDASNIADASDIAEALSDIAEAVAMQQKMESEMNATEPKVAKQSSKVHSIDVQPPTEDSVDYEISTQGKERAGDKEVEVELEDGTKANTVLRPGPIIKDILLEYAGGEGDPLHDQVIAPMLENLELEHSSRRGMRAGMYIFPESGKGMTDLRQYGGYMLQVQPKHLNQEVARLTQNIPGRIKIKVPQVCGTYFIFVLCRSTNFYLYCTGHFRYGTNLYYQIISTALDMVWY